VTPKYAKNAFAAAVPPGIPRRGGLATLLQTPVGWGGVDRLPTPHTSILVPAVRPCFGVVLWFLVFPTFRLQYIAEFVDEALIFDDADGVEDDGVSVSV